ncbi:MAG: hypothetical protein ACPLXP_02495 [Microgenomates group bacterium]
MTLFETYPPDSRYYKIGVDGPFSLFNIVLLDPAGNPTLFICLSNPVRRAIYEDLKKKEPSSLGEFEKDEFLKLSVEDLQKILESYLNSEPDQQAAEERFQILTSPQTRIPGGGRVIRVYTSR